MHASAAATERKRNATHQAAVLVRDPQALGRVVLLGEELDDVVHRRELVHVERLSAELAADL